MRFLFADDTPAPFDADTLVMLREAIACAVALFEASDAIDQRKIAIDTRGRLAARRYADIQDLGRRLVSTLGERRETAELAELADRIRQAASDEVAAEVRAVRGSVEQERERLRQEIARISTDARTRILDFLRAYDLPGSRGRLELAIAGDGAYASRLRLATDRELHATFVLAVPDSGPLSAPLRVRELVGNLKVKVARRGRLRSKPKVAARNLSRGFVVGVVHTGSRTLLKLRDEPSACASGVDIDFDGADIEVRPVVAADESPLPSHRPDASDTTALRELERAVLELVLPLAEHRVRVLGAAVDERGLETLAIDELARHIVDSIGETFRTIATRSGGAKELVLIERVSSGQRRRLSLDLRELDALVDGLPARLRTYFAVLSLGSVKAGPPAPPGRRRQTEVDQGW